MMRRTIRRHISATPEQVMDALLNLSQWSRWRPGLEDVRNVSDAPVLHSTAWNERRRLAGRSLTLLARAVEVDPPRIFAYTAGGDGFDVVFRWTVKWDNERALITQETGVRATGLRNRISGAAHTFLVQQDDALDQFRHLFPTLEKTLTSSAT